MSDEDKRNNSTGIYSDDNGNSYSSSSGAVASTGNAYNVQTKTTLKTQNISLDFKPSYQIDQNNSVYGILGVTYLQIKLRKTFYIDDEYTSNYKRNILTPAVGVGYKLKIDDNFSVRSQFKYSYLNKEIGDSEVKIKSLTQLSVGFAYNF